MVGDSAALNITTRGLKYVFRATPHRADYARTYMRFFADMKKEGKKIGSIAIVNENTDYGTSVGDAIEAEAKKSDIPVAIRIPMPASSTDVSPRFLQLKEKQPDVIIFVSYHGGFDPLPQDDEEPRLQAANDPWRRQRLFRSVLHPGGERHRPGVMNRSAWAIGKPGSTTSKINDMYKAKTGRDLDDTSARNMQGFLALADAINRAARPIQKKSAPRSRKRISSPIS